MVNIPQFLAAVTEIKRLAASLQPKLPKKIPVLLTKCYTEERLTDLFKIRQAYLEIAPSLSEELQSLFFIAICAILRPSSHVGTAQWQYILPNKGKAKTCEPFDALENQLAMMQEDLYQMQFISSESRATFIQ